MNRSTPIDPHGEGEDLDVNTSASHAAGAMQVSVEGHSGTSGSGQQAHSEEPASPLSTHDLLVLQLLARGYTPAQAATLCNRSEVEVREAAARATQGLDALDTSHAILIALRRGLIV